MARPLLLLAAIVSAPALAQTVALPKTDYGVREPIVVTYRSSSTAADWVTVVPVGNASDDYDQWSWLPDDSGTITFDGLAAGSYEVRAFCCWAPGRPGHGGYNVVSRASFRVAGSASARQSAELELDATRIPAGRPITIGYFAEPAYESDWIAIARAGTPDDAYERWSYTGGYEAGSLTLDGVPAGTYEVRFYCCWRETNEYGITARRTIVVE